MQHIPTAPAVRNSPSDREFFIASLRSASLQYKTWAAELEMIGTALRNDQMALGTAVEWAADLGLLHYLPPAHIDGEQVSA